MAVGLSCAAEQLLNEDHHLILLDGAGVVLVEGAEHLVEGLSRELITGSEVAKSVLNELLGLILVESAGLIDIVSVPDLVDDALDRLFLRSGHLKDIIINNTLNWGFGVLGVPYPP